ncbi:MAG: hypothetical protein Kow0025_12400 [Thermodesulfovibrionales bacterium]
MAGLKDRIIRAAKLDVGLYEEVESDPAATGQAVGVVVLSSLAAGLGTISRGGLSGIAVAVVAALVTWFLWAYLTYFIGAKIIPEPQTNASPGQMLRALGFASSPGLIRVLGVIPGLTGFVFMAASVWMLVAMVIAVRQALDYQSTWRAIGVCAIGWVVQIVVVAVLLYASGFRPP